MTRIGMTRSLRVTDFDFALESETVPVRASGTVSGDTALTLVLRMGKDDPPDTQRVALSGPMLLPTLVPLAIALAERPKVGRKYTLPVFDPTTMAPRSVVLTVTSESLF